MTIFMLSEAVWLRHFPVRSTHNILRSQTVQTIGNFPKLTCPAFLKYALPTTLPVAPKSLQPASSPCTKNGLFHKKTDREVKDILF